MITVTVSVISITAVIVGYAGVAAFTGVAKSKVSKCAASIKALIDVAANDDENYNCIASRNYTDDDMETDICKSYSMVFVFSNIIWYNNSIYAIFR